MSYKVTAKFIFDGVEFPYEPEKHRIVTPTTAPRALAHELGEKFFGTKMVALGGDFRTTKVLEDDVFEMTAEVELVEGVKIGPNHYTYVGTRTIKGRWVAVEDFR